jgi:hypothetical protein
MIFPTHDRCSEVSGVAVECTRGLLFQPRGGRAELRPGGLPFQVRHPQQVVGGGPQISLWLAKTLFDLNWLMLSAPIDKLPPSNAGSKAVFDCKQRSSSCGI